MPERWAALPPALFAVLHGVDLLLHAGDVGELWVLDRLSTMAPVVAVHGNDDTEEAQRELPYQQTIAVAGQRILLCHSHYPDHASEMDSRRGDAWTPKLDRRVALGKRAGAAVVVFGHTHIPMTRRHQGVLLVNPGAIASSSTFARQRVQTVALLFLRDDGGACVVDVDLAAPERAFVPQIDWDAGFSAALDMASASIVSPDLAADRERLVRDVLPLAPAEVRALVLRVAHRCWSGQQEVFTRDDLLAEVRMDTSIPADVRGPSSQHCGAAPEDVLHGGARVRRITLSEPQQEARVLHAAEC
jgi:putative phosphoesterase